MDNAKPLLCLSACILLTAVELGSAQTVEEPLTAPQRPQLELLEEVPSRYSLILNCDSCKISQVTMSWEIQAPNIDTIELYHVDNNNRSILATLGASDRSNVTTITNSTDFSDHAGACFDIITTFHDGSTETSRQTCFDMS